MLSPKLVRRLRGTVRVALKYLWRPVFTTGGRKNLEIKEVISRPKDRYTWEAFLRQLFPHVPEHYPLHRKLQLAKSQSKWGRNWDILMIFMSLYACALYVAEQYDSSYNAVHVYSVSEIVVTQFFAADFLYTMASASSLMHFFVNPWTIVDLVTIVPVYITLGLGSSSVVKLSVLRFVRILRLVRILRMFKILKGLSGVKKQLITLTLTLLSLLFMAAGIMQFMENDVKQMLEYACNSVGPYTNWEPSCDINFPFVTETETSNGHPCDCLKYSCKAIYSTNDLYGQPSDVACPRLTFLSAFYYILVTAATVGYGDIAPSNEYSRAVVIFIIATTMIVIPVQLNALNKLLSLTSIYRQPYDRPHDDHVVVCGYVQDWRKLEEVLKELLHPDRSSNNSGNEDLHIVILSPLEPSEDIKTLLNKVQFDGRVSYLIGSALNMNDLQRVRADIAKAMFFLCNSEIHESKSKIDDAAIVLRTLSVNNYNPKIGCFVQILKSEDRDILKEAKLDMIVCLDEMKTIVQARNCVCPGISVIIENLFRSFGQSLEEQVGNRCYLTNKAPWQQVYIKGASKELYAVGLSLLFVEAMSFEWSLIAEAIYLEFDCIVIGAYSSTTGAVIMNPDRAAINKYRYVSKFYEAYDSVIVIANERSEVDRIEVGINDSGVLQRIVKKLTIAEDFFTVRRKLPINFKPGVRCSRAKSTLRELSRLTKAYCKQGGQVKEETPLEVTAEYQQEQQEGFLQRAKQNVWGTLQGGVKQIEEVLLRGNPNRRKVGIAEQIHNKYGQQDSDDDDDIEGARDDRDEESKNMDEKIKATRNRRGSQWNVLSNKGGGSSSPTGNRKRANSPDFIMASPTRLPASTVARNANIIEDAGHLSGHVIVFGSTANLQHFVLEMRRPIITKAASHAILVVDQEIPAHWDYITDVFPDVYLLRGKMTSATTFNMTNVKYAHSIVLLSGRDNVTKVEEEYLDADTLFTYMKLESHIPKNVFFAVELTCASNMAVLNASVLRRAMEGREDLQAIKRMNEIVPTKVTIGFQQRVEFHGKQTVNVHGSFLNHLALKEEDALQSLVKAKGARRGVNGLMVPGGGVEQPAVDLAKANIVDDTFWTVDDTINVLPVFASGHAYVPTCFDSMLVQSFYNSFVPSVCEALICGNGRQTLHLVELPRCMAGRFFVDLYRSYLSRYLLVIGLYRGPDDFEQNILSYVVTNPEPDVVLRITDRLYCYGDPETIQKFNDELQVIDINEREVSLYMTLGQTLNAAAKQTSKDAGKAENKAPKAASQSPVAQNLPSKKDVRQSSLILIKANIAEAYIV